MSNSENARSMTRPSLIRPVSNHNSSEVSKSRLVQPRYSTRSSISVNANNQCTDKDEPPSPTKTSSRSSESTKPVAGVAAEGTMPTRLRPRSMYQTRSTTSQRAEQSAKSSSQSMRPPPPPPPPVSKIPETQAGGLGRAQSLRRPAVPSQSTRPAGAASHSRTQSVNAAVFTRREAAKTAATLERPKSLVGAANAGVRANGPSTDTATSGGSVPGRLGAHRRAASTKAKLETWSSSSELKPAPRPKESDATQTGHRDGAPEGQKKTSRPAFSTLQQHFTPRKTGKAPTSTFLHPAPSSGPQTLPPEISNLQTELLQLHLLHQSCNDVCRQWELSAKRSFRTRFEEVASLHQTMLEHERAGQEQKNLQSLIDWSTGRSPTGLAEHIQALSAPLHELPSLVEPGGRLQRQVAAFEHWISWVQDVRRARQDPTTAATTTGSRTIEGLGDSWKSENTSLVRKLASFARALDTLDAAPPTPGSSLACIVQSCKALMAAALEELQLMHVIEAELVAKEQGWVEERLGMIARGVGGCEVEGCDEGAAWRK
ncbi:hypothetical protein LEMA_P114980.1 [Plenodomus lingam JN3]|uniref:Uncharacterized protein n=1 Tax=Leptosphaeria maculans (strain JN3 / isolate v23.1.3 / race Av1-4-5-6-7-8) TaxID=985895 RepID=E4ZUK4_LEPMJ|nr:hypothetical protein LEMA_P114980.1 [Plenodomus lingam JN3]CBX95083.1 hypothetical protein LEMA_P114980.1 [Plenodomus lingam JN3]